MLRRGALIVLEGCDRVGKSTHAKLLYEALKGEGYKVESLQFPDRSTVIGNILNKYLEGSEEVEDHAVHLLFSANRWEQVGGEEEELAGLNNKAIVLSAAPHSADLLWSSDSLQNCPRQEAVIFQKCFNASHCVYFLVLREGDFGLVRGLNFSWCKQADVGLPKPDLVLYLDLSSEAMAKRSGFGEERYETEEFQNEVKKVYGLLREDNWKVVDTDKEQSEVQEELQSIVKETIKNLSSAACDTLWTDNFETYV